MLQPEEQRHTRSQDQYNIENFEILELEENSEEEQFADLDSYMAHHNMYQASQHLRQDYQSCLHKLDDSQYYTEINRTYYPQETPAAQDYWLANQQAAPRRSTEELQMPTIDYFFMNIQPEPMIVSPHRRNHSELTAQHTATEDPVSQQTHPLQPGKTRVYPSMLADKQVPVLGLTSSTITSQADLQTVFQSIHLGSMKEDDLSHGRKESREDEDTQ